MIHRLKTEMAGSPKPMADYRNADPAQAFPMAIDAMRNPAFLKTPKYQEQQTRAKIAGAHPDIVEFSRKLIKRGASMGIPLFAHCIVRSFDEQASAFVRGISRDSPKDGLWPHRFAAVDIVHGTKAWDLTAQQWAVLGHLGKEVANSMSIDVEWGGDWNFYDPAHWEIYGWKSLDPHSFAPKATVEKL